MKKIIVIVMALGAFLGAGTLHQALAAEFIAAPDGQKDITISQTETHKNAYVAARTVSVSGATTGDLHIAGGVITVDGSVEQDIAVAGINITVNSTVGGDARIAGDTVIINNTVGGDVIVLAGTLHITDKASIGGDVIVAGGDVTIDGPVTGNVRIMSDTAVINNHVGGDIKLQTNNDVTFGSKADVPGHVTYRGARQATVQDGAQVSSIDFQPTSKHTGATKRLFAVLSLAFVLKLITLIIAAFLASYFFPKSINDGITRVEKRPWINLGIGFLIFILGPFLIVILLANFTVGMLGILAYLAMLIVATLVAAMFVGAWIIKLLTKKPDLRIDWQAIVIGVAVLAVLPFIPVVGFIVAACLILSSFGALIRMLIDRSNSERKTTTVVD